MDNYIVLENNTKMPIIGFGTYKLGNEEETVEAVKQALKMGYRYIDTASFDNNEKSIGKAIKESNIKRSELFITGKVWNNCQGYEQTIISFNQTLKNLNLDYLDLYLIHWPTKLNIETWRAFETLYKRGKIKAIGVCNFKTNHLEDLMEHAQIMPMVNQIEIHPRNTQKETIKYCIENNIQTVAWGPLSRGIMLENEVIKQLSQKYNKEAAQIILRWHIQNNIVPIPKSSNKGRIKTNLNMFDFELSKADMNLIDSLDLGESISKCPDGTIYFE